VNELVDDLPDPPGRPATAPTSQALQRSRLDRALRAIPAPDDVHALTGRAPDRAGKILCPFHDLSGSRAVDDEVPPAPSLADASASECRRGSRTSSDPLRLVPPPVYFERLTGLRVGRSGKLHCLFHDDRSPSLHVYPEPERGWYCFGCGRGGSIFDLAALLLGRGTRGSDFVEIRRVLEQLLLPSRLVSQRQLEAEATDHD
jgi:hypothetical protein